jgi:hypothetical protein
MSRELGYVIVLTLVSVPLSAQSGKAPHGSISGTVYCTDTSTPCRFASVDLTPATAGHRPSPSSEEGSGLTAATDIQGHFELHDIPVGGYFVSPRLPGYFTVYDLAVAEYGGSPLQQKALDVAVQQVEIQSNQTISVALNLTRAGSISGTANYDDGGFGIDLPVQILRRDANGKWKPFVSSNGMGIRALVAGNIATDDRGRYRFATLPPGTYTVRVCLPDPDELTAGVLMIMAPGMSDTPRTNTLSVYLGGQSVPDDKSAIEIREGDDVAGQDMIVPTHNLWSLSGTVAGTFSGAQSSSRTLSLFDSSGKTLLRTADMSDAGEFSFTNLPGGSYRLTVNAACPNSAEQWAIGDTPLSSAISVQGDISDVLVHCTAQSVQASTL